VISQELIADVIAALLRRVNVPNDEIVEVTDKILVRGEPWLTIKILAIITALW
jgi:hypothetical protein